MVDRLLAIVEQQVLLADIGDVVRLRIFGEQVIEGLILRGPQVFRDRLVPFFAVRKLGVDVEDDAAKVEQAVPNDLTNGETSDGNVELRCHGTGTRDGVKWGHAYYLGKANARC